MATTAQRRSLPGVFVVTWLAYATSYLGRKGFSVAKVRIAAQLGLSDGALAAVDTAYLIAYAVGQFVSGALGASCLPLALAALVALVRLGAGEGRLRFVAGKGALPAGSTLIFSAVVATNLGARFEALAKPSN